MQSPIARFLVSFLTASAIAVLLGGFFALVFGAMAGAMLPGDIKGALVSPYVCPSGSDAKLETWDSQCSSTNRNSGTCQQFSVSCVDGEGKVTKELDPNTSMLWVMGVVMAYLFVAFGGLLFLVVFFPMLVLLSRRAKRKAAAPPAPPAHTFR